ncbi:hypothetical protein LMED105_05152 [Limnobacter sp. MED105]|nr:hypothetical protein LMED105_05152 [Limnobacter sp. MED105]
MLWPGLFMVLCAAKIGSTIEMGLLGQI